MQDYVEKRIEVEKNNNAPAKQETSQSGGGLFGGFFGSSPAPAPRVHMSGPSQPKSSLKKLPGLYVYGGPGLRTDFENILDFV